MDSQWETVLVEWINCLSFGKPLQSVEELHDGEFFNSFHKTIQKSTDIICDDLTFIFELLTMHYPKFEILDKSSVHVSNLSRSDLINLTSLLLHYTCIHDRRNVLTSPMCHNLSSTTQQHIKSFLEKVTSDISYSELENVIKSLFIKKQKIPCQIYNSASSNKETPLQDILRTPTSKMKKIEEKDKEIRTLKRELETEKFYKIDLEDDIKDLSDKVVKLETKLEQKCSEVTRLKGEVEAMQMCQPPHCQHVNSRETERLLKLELKSLEQYIHQCELDQEELRNERDIVKDKARKLENDCAMWQEKYFENDNTIQIYLEHVRELEGKNDNLQTHCFELEALLDEYRCKSSNSFEESTIIDGYNRRSKSFEPCEDLAYSVVDVQLRETQKKLNEVLEELNDTLEGKMKLEEDMELYKEKLIITEGTLDKITVEKDGLELKIKQIADENGILVQQINELVTVKNKFEKESGVLSQILNETMSKFQSCQEEKDACSKLLVETESHLKKVEESMKYLLIQNSTINNDLEGTKRQLTTVEGKWRKADMDLKQTLLDLSESSKSLKDLQNILEKEKQDNQDLEKELTRVQTTLKNKEQEVHKYQSLSQTVSDEFNKLKVEQTVTEKKLEEANELLKHMNKALHEEQEKLHKEEVEKDALSEKIQRLMKLSDSLSNELQVEKTEKVSLSAKICEMNQTNGELAEKLHDLKRSHSEEKISNESLRNEIGTLKDQLTAVQNQYAAALTDLQDNKYSLQGTLVQLQDQTEENKKILLRVKDLEIKLAETDKNMLETKEHLHQVIQEKIMVEKESQEKIWVLEQSLINDKDCLDAEVKRLSMYCESLLGDVKVKAAEVANLKDELIHIKLDESVLIKKNEDIMALKNQLDEELNELETREENNKLSMRKELDEEKVINDNLRQEATELERQLTLVKAQLEHDLMNAEEEKRILLRSLDQTVEKLETKDKLLTELNQQTINLQEKLEKTERLFQQAREEKTVISNFLDLNTSELTKISQDNEEILEALEMSNKDKLALIEENRMLKIKLDDAQQSYDRTYKEMCELMLEKDKLTRDNAEVLGNLQTIIKEKEELFGELNKISTDLEQLKKDHEILNTDHQQCVNAKAKQDLALQMENLTVEIAEIRKERDELKDSVEKVREEKSHLLLSLELSQKEAQKIKKERNEILQSQTELMKETESNIQRAHEAAVVEKRELLSKVDVLEKERQKLREAYATVVTNHAKQETENVNLRKKIEERNQQIQQFSSLKDAYEKLLEENNKYMTDIDTVKFKRSKDREEFLNLLKKEREEADARQNRKVREVRAEYEEKLGKMKDKMIKLYREEVNKELVKVKGDQGDMVYFQKTIDELHGKLSEAEETIQMLTLERDMLKAKENIISRESLSAMVPIERNGPKHSISLRGRGNKVADRDSVISTSASSVRESYSRDHLQKLNGQSRKTGNNRAHAADFIEETITFSRRTSINSLGRNFEMEDEEDDMFNNKYLVDLKEGRCSSHTGRESNVTRMSELAWRNSMVPPHLKSSYPAETQFVSPTRFREDDLKTGNVALDDSLSKLLPGEKPRQKKDFGTTTYKKPGPPTPSKNGGRLSLQGSEVAPLREANHASPPKKVTPGRLRALFTGRKESGTKENTENVTPRAPRRLSLFKNRK